MSRKNMNRNSNLQTNLDLYVNLYYFCTYKNMPYGLKIDLKTK